MPVACPNPSALECVCIGGQLDPACCDEAFGWPTLKVTAELIGVTRDGVFDPTNCAQVPPTKIEEIFETGDGCWSTCDLKPNFNSDDPDLALQPGDTKWKITVQGSQNFNPVDGTGNFTVLAGPWEIAIDGAEDYSALEPECCVGPEGCVNIRCLLGPQATLPPTNLFCEAVYACLAPIAPAGLISVTGDFQNGYTIGLTCDDVAGCFGGIGQGGIAQVTGDFLAGFTVSVTCADVVACVQPALDGLQSQIDANTAAIASAVAAAQSCCDANAAVIADNAADIAANSDAIAAIDICGAMATSHTVSITESNDPDSVPTGTLTGSGCEGFTLQLEIPQVSLVDVCGFMATDHTVTFTEGTDPLAAPSGTLVGNGCDGFALDIELPPCPVTTCATDPATGAAVVIDLTTGTPTYTSADGSPWTGDPSTLI